jgi:hypothetical protein
MNPHLHYILAQQRVADRQRAAEHARLARGAATGRSGSRDSYPIVRALPMPTAHPSPEAWPAAGVLAGTSLAPAPTRPAPRFAAPVPNTCSRRAPLQGLPGSRSPAIREARPSQRARERLRPAFVPGHGDELGSIAFSQPQTAPACFERSDQLARLVYERLDAHSDTEHLSGTPHSELLRHAHLRSVRDLERVAREVLAGVS